MNPRRQYVKRATQLVVAVQLDLQTDGFTYRKWGGEQRCKRGDWLINNEGEIYTVDCDTFARTYKPASLGTYTKATTVWAEIAIEAGDVRTKEGATHYQPGDYIVYNEPDSGDGYAIEKDPFERMYERSAELSAPD